jgi:hypothetical protein
MTTKRTTAKLMKLPRTMPVRVRELSKMADGWREGKCQYSEYKTPPEQIWSVKFAGYLHTCTVPKIRIVAFPRDLFNIHSKNIRA